MSREDVPPDPGLTGVEAALKSLTPAPSRVDRDLVMFRAGRASARLSERGRTAWMAAAASLALLAAGEGALLARKPASVVVERVVVVREQGTTVAAPPPVETVVAEPTTWSDPADYQRLTWQIMRYGLDGLPASPAVATRDSAEPPPSRQLLIEELRDVLEPGDPS